MEIELQQVPAIRGFAIREFGYPRRADDPFCDHLFARNDIPRLFSKEIQENNFKKG